MNYLELKIIFPEEKQAFLEIIIAFLAEQGFESFTEENQSLLAYIQEELFDKKSADMLMTAYNLQYSTKIIPQQNWNEEWEKSFDPIVIDNILTIKAPFHKDDYNTEYTIIIEPKMSFGTGHHATTHMMCKLISEYDFSESQVLDFGSGTGILAIYASILGASNIVAVDIDEWAYENCTENAQRNNIANINCIKGDINAVPEKKYDFIFANINLNVLKKDIPYLAKQMNSGGFIILSGFLANEINQIKHVCENNGLFFVKNIEKDNWIACIFHFTQ